MMTIHPQLLADSHALLNWQNCHVRLHKNASLPWVIIIPNTKEIEFCDLPNDLQLEITGLSQIIGNYFKQACGTEKINFAAIGNVVQQLHIHVIGRNSTDPLWPDVVWGRDLPDKSYSPEQIEELKQQLKAVI
ncbi:MAG: HIT family protein [Proteobacteria bacterium]|nr:HIT family protein [Pseudomonadota bacterium]